MRKTFSIAKLKENINNQILHLADEHVVGRQALQSALESILHEVGAYQGFQYLDANDMKKSLHGTSVGINEHTHADDWHVKFDGTDRTRVKYF